MKNSYRILPAIFLLLASAVFAQVPPPGEKENPFAKEYEKQGKKVPSPVTDTTNNTVVKNAPRLPSGIDSAEMKYLAEFIQDPHVSIGVFDNPGEEVPLRMLTS